MIDLLFLQFVQLHNAGRSELRSKGQILVLEPFKQYFEVVQHQHWVLGPHRPFLIWLHKLRRQVELQHKYGLETLINSDQQLVPIDVDLADGDPLELIAE